MKTEWTKKFNKGQAERTYNKLDENIQKDLDSFLDWRTNRGCNSESKLNDYGRQYLQMTLVLEKPLFKITVEEVFKLSTIIKKSVMSESYINEILTTLKSYCKFRKIKDIDLDDIQLIREPRNKIKIIDGEKDLLTKKDIEKLVRFETKLFWKAFLLVQYEGGLRTGETRLLKWKDINFNIDGDLSEVTIYATKTKSIRTVFVKEATHYLQLLRQEQENLEQRGDYIFHSKNDLTIPINRAQISLWMKRLSKRALGREVWNYVLRHSRGNELYQLSKQNKISKDTALSYMGHSEKMSKVYTHPDKEKIKKMLKDQIYHLEDLPPEKKTELQEEIKKQNIEIQTLRNENEEIKNFLEQIRPDLENFKNYLQSKKILKH